MSTIEELKQTQYITGKHYAASAFGYELVVADIGANLISLTKDGLDVTVPVPDDEFPRNCSGQILVPWPNRVEAGKYTFEGTEYQFSINEIGLNNALHGYGFAHRWELVAQTSASLTFAIRLPQVEGYPFDLFLQAAYSLAEDGLTLIISAENMGQNNAPFAAGFHPYLSHRGAELDQCDLELPASEILEVNSKNIPVGKHDVLPAEDFRERKTLKGADFDDAWVSTIFDSTSDGDVASAKLWNNVDGHLTTVWTTRSMPCWQVFTANGVTPSRWAIAVEPQSACANAFNSGDDLLTLEPGDIATFTCGISFE